MSLFGLLASSNYIIINRDVLKKVGLDAAVMLAELADEERYYEDTGKIMDGGWFFSTLTNIGARTGLSRWKQDRALEALKSCNLVEYSVKGVPPKRYFKLNQDGLQEIINGKPICKPLANQNVSHSQIDLQESNKLICENPTNRFVSHSQQRITNKRITTGEEEQSKENIKKKHSPAKLDAATTDASVLEVVSYLNEKANKNFGARSKSTEKFIKARLNDGATVEEMKAVIDRKVSQWKDDPKMNQFLRPKTLFNETNFESYRNESEPEQECSYMDLVKTIGGDGCDPGYDSGDADDGGDDLRKFFTS